MTDMAYGENATISGIDEVSQSIRMILTTPKGSRPLNREFGSLLYQKIDDPITQRHEILIEAATVIDRWEKRIELKRIDIKDIKEGKIYLTIEGIYRPENKPVAIGVGI